MSDTQSAVARYRGALLQLSLFLALAAVARFADVFYHFVDWDEAALMAESWATSAGEPLYTRTWQIHPPLPFWWFGLLFRLFPPEAVPHIAKVLNILLVGTCAFLAARIVGCFTRRAAGSFMAGLLVACHLSWRSGYVSSYSELYVLLPVLTSWWALLSYHLAAPECRSWMRLGLAGAMMPVALGCKQTALFDVAALLVAHLLLVRDRPLRERARSLGVLAGGAAATTLALFAVLAATGSLPGALDLLSPSSLQRYVQAGGGRALLVILNVLRDFRPELALVAATVIVAAIGRLRGAAAPAEVSRRRLSLIALGLLAAALAAMIAERWFSSSVVVYFVLRYVRPLLLVPALAILAFVTWVVRPRSDAVVHVRGESAALSAMLAGVLVTIGVFAVSGRFYPHYAIQVAPLLAIVAGSVLNHMPSPARRLTASAAGVLLGVPVLLATVRSTSELARGHFVPPAVSHSGAVAKIIRAHTQKTDRIFLAGTCNLDIYYLAERLSPNGMYMWRDMFAAHIGDRRFERDKKQALLAMPPRVVVLDQECGAGFAPGAAFMRAFVTSGYTLADTVGSTQLFLRTGDALGPAPAGPSPN